MKLPRFTRPKSAVLIGAIAIVLFAGLASFFFWRYMSVKSGANSQQSNIDKSTKIVEAVDRLYRLPTDETPTVAAIQDKTKLEGQEFFKDAANGDYLLIYKQAGFALLYSEKENRLINVRPVDLGADKGVTAGASTQAKQ
jgi:hypothetical protein